jgi:type I restriction enzyme S subunit
MQKTSLNDLKLTKDEFENPQLKSSKINNLQKLEPKLRFRDYTYAWEPHLLGEFTNIETGKLDANAMVENGKYDFYTSGIKKFKIDTPAFRGPAITIAGNGATVGYMHLADGEFNAYQRTYVLTDFFIDRYFLFSEIGKNLPKKIHEEARAGNIPYIVMEMLTNLPISVPVNIKEQKQIGSFFKNIDDLITLHQRKLKHLSDKRETLLKKVLPKKNDIYPELRFSEYGNDV